MKNNFKWKNINSNQYIAEIKIPWKDLGIQAPESGMKIGFDAAIGDNDDGYIQKAKITWNSPNDNMLSNFQNYGELELIKGSHTSNSSKSLFSSFCSPKIDGEIDSMWSNTTTYPIENLVHGYIKDKLDLSATVQSAWDSVNLYFLIQVLDSRQKHVTPDKINEREIFVDYGWIEDGNGEIVWKMRAKESKYAGGAFKNQKVDTALTLEGGQYIVKYISDESHAYNNWNDIPPETPFYGIVLYEAK